MASTEAQKRASLKYLQTQDDIRIRVPKGTKDRWRAKADSAGKSLQRYIIDAVEGAEPVTDIKKEPEA
jgi:predicted DNA binding CopG/RHH family protein